MKIAELKTSGGYAYADYQYLGKNLKAKVFISHKQDDWPDGDFDFGSTQENAKYLDRFRSGELLCTAITVTLRSNCGLEGISTLGMCHLLASDIEREVDQCVDQYSMLDIALDDLKASIDEARKEFL